MKSLFDVLNESRVTAEQKIKFAEELKIISKEILLRYTYPDDQSGLLRIAESQFSALIWEKLNGPYSKEFREFYQKLNEMVRSQLP